MGPLLVKINDWADTRERGQAILDVVQDVHHGIQETNRRPIFDVRPITGLSRQCHNDDQQYYETVETRLDGIVQDGGFGNQIKAMRSEFKEALESHKANRESYQAGLQKELDVLTKIARGTLIVSVITAGGALLWKLFGKKKDGENGKSQVVNNKKVAKRLHARSWTDGTELCVRSTWDNYARVLRDLTNSGPIESTETRGIIIGYGRC